MKPIKPSEPKPLTYIGSRYEMPRRFDMTDEELKIQAALLHKPDKESRRAWLTYVAVVVAVVGALVVFRG